MFACVCVRRQQRRDLLRNERVQPRRDVGLDDTVSVPAERVDLRVAEQVALIGHRRPLRSGSVLWAPGTSELDRAAGCRVLFFSVPPSLRGFVHSGHFTPPPTHPPRAVPRG